MGKHTQAHTNTKMPGYRGRNYQSSGNDGLVARKEEERIRKYRENEARQAEREREREWAREARMREQQRKDDSARALGFDDARHKKRITAAMDTVCGKVERMKNDGLPHVTLTVQSADDGGQTEVTVSDEARVADVLAVACRAQHKPLPRSTLSFGGDNLDAFMAEKLTDLDIETEAVLRLVQLCDGQVNDLALGALTEKDGPTHCTCFSWLFSR